MVRQVQQSTAETAKRELSRSLAARESGEEPTWSVQGTSLHFARRSIDIVKSISQRSLVRYWQSIRGPHPLPAFNDFAPPSRLHDTRQLMFWQVDASQEQRRYYALHQGKNVDEVLQVQWIVGLSLEQIVPEPLREFSLAGSHCCAGTSQPVYMVISTTDGDGHAINCERLLLPFGAGTTAEQLVGSLQLISANGTFDRRTVLDNFRQSATVTLACRIPA